MNTRLQPTKFDVVVVGAGSAGVAAAVAAAASGARVLVIERNPFAGGKATAAMVGTVCGLYLTSKKDEALWAVGGFARSFAETLAEQSNSSPEKFFGQLHFLPYRIQAFKDVCAQYLAHPNIEVWWNASVKKMAHSTDRIEKLTVLRNGEEVSVFPNTVVDCSGEAVISQLAGSSWVAGGENQAAAQVFSMRGLATIPTEAIHFTLSVALRRAIVAGDLSPEFSALSVVPGSYRNGSALLKLPLAAEVTNDAQQREQMRHDAGKKVTEVISFLVQNVSLFADAELQSLAPEVGFRTGYRSLGRATLQEEDVLQSKLHPEGIANGAWPVEFWTAGQPVEMTLFEESAYYQIPAACLESKNAKNLYFAGRNLSATPKAMASARVMGTCLQTGFAAGKLAAAFAQGKPREGVVDEIRRELKLDER